MSYATLENYNDQDPIKLPQKEIRREPEYKVPVHKGYSPEYYPQPERHNYAATPEQYRAQHQHPQQLSRAERGHGPHPQHQHPQHQHSGRTPPYYTQHPAAMSPSNYQPHQHIQLSSAERGHGPQPYPPQQYQPPPQPEVPQTNLRPSQNLRPAHVRGSMATYYKDILFTKYKDLPEKNTSLYAACIFSNLSKDIRYVIAVVSKDKYPLGAKFELYHLPWLSLQTRTLEEDLELSPQNHNASDFSGQDPIINARLQAVGRDERATRYKCDVAPLEILLLHNPKYKNAHQYPDEINVRRALQTYNCVLKLPG